MTKEIAPAEPHPSLKEKTDAAIAAVSECIEKVGTPPDKIADLMDTLRDCVNAEKKEIE